MDTENILTPSRRERIGGMGEKSEGSKQRKRLDLAAVTEQIGLFSGSCASLIFLSNHV